MLLKKNIRLGRISKNLLILYLFLFFPIFQDLYSSERLIGNYTNIKVLDKISSKNILVKLQTRKEREREGRSTNI